MWPLICNEVGLSYDQEDRVRVAQRKMLLDHPSWVTRHASAASKQTIQKVCETAQRAAHKVRTREDALLKILTAEQRIRYLNWSQRRLSDATKRIKKQQSSSSIGTIESSPTGSTDWQHVNAPPQETDTDHDKAAHLYRLTQRLEESCAPLPVLKALAPPDQLKKLSRRPMFETLGNRTANMDKHDNDKDKYCDKDHCADSPTSHSTNGKKTKFSAADLSLASGSSGNLTACSLGVVEKQQVMPEVAQAQAAPHVAHVLSSVSDCVSIRFAPPATAEDDNANAGIIMNMQVPYAAPAHYNTMAPPAHMAGLGRVLPISSPVVSGDPIPMMTVSNVHVNAQAVRSTPVSVTAQMQVQGRVRTPPVPPQPQYPQAHAQVQLQAAGDRTTPLALLPYTPAHVQGGGTTSAPSPYALPAQGHAQTQGQAHWSHENVTRAANYMPIIPDPTPVLPVGSGAPRPGSGAPRPGSGAGNAHQQHQHLQPRAFTPLDSRMLQTLAPTPPPPPTPSSYADIAPAPAQTQNLMQMWPSLEEHLQGMVAPRAVQDVTPQAQLQTQPPQVAPPPVPRYFYPETPVPVGAHASQAPAPRPMVQGLAHNREISLLNSPLPTAHDDFMMAVFASGGVSQSHMQPPPPYLVQVQQMQQPQYVNSHSVSSQHHHQLAPQPPAAQHPAAQQHQHQHEYVNSQVQADDFLMQLAENDEWAIGGGFDMGMDIDG
jgi:hypothetical protein